MARLREHQRDPCAGSEGLKPATDPTLWPGPMPVGLLRSRSGAGEPSTEVDTGERPPDESRACTGVRTYMSRNLRREPTTSPGSTSGRYSCRVVSAVTVRPCSMQSPGSGSAATSCPVATTTAPAATSPPPEMRTPSSVTAVTVRPVRSTSAGRRAASWAGTALMAWPRSVRRTGALSRTPRPAQRPRDLPTYRRGVRPGSQRPVLPGLGTSRPRSVPRCRVIPVETSTTHAHSKLSRDGSHVADGHPVRQSADVNLTAGRSSRHGTA